MYIHELELPEMFAAARPLTQAEINFNFPEELKPIPLPITPRPIKSDPLPKVDIVIIAWTVSEVYALSDIFTWSYHRPIRSNPTSRDWYEYNRNFESKFKDQIRKGAPSRGDCDNIHILGIYFLSSVADKKFFVLNQNYI